MAGNPEARVDLYFASPAFLWVLPLAACPVLLHVRARAKQRAVNFPGAFFLQDPALPSAERRRRIEDFFLLALRTLLLALATLALAGPRLRGLPESASNQADSESGSEAVVLVLDDSPSLAQRGGAPGANALERAVRDLAAAFGNGARRRIAVETTSGRSLPFANSQGMLSRLREWAGELAQGSVRSGSRATALARAVRLLQEATEDRRLVVLVTDLGLNEDEGHETRLESGWTAALNLFSEPFAPVLLVVDAAPAPGKQWAVEALLPWVPGAGARAPVAGQPFSMRVRLRCHGGAGTRRLRVESSSTRFETRDPPVAEPALRAQAPAVLLERTVSLDSGESVELEIPALATVPGPMGFRALLEDPDEWPFDDQAETVVEVTAKSEVLLWDLRRPFHEPAPPMDAPRQALAAALDPLAGSSASRVSLQTSGTPRIEALRPGAVLAALHGPQGPYLNQEVSERLRGLLLAGLHVLWLPDLTGKPERWPRAAPGRKLAADPLLPRDIERVEERERREPGADRDPPAWHLGLHGIGHPLLAAFAGGRNGDLAGVRFRRRLVLDSVKEKQPGWTANSGTREDVLARFDDGLPAILYRRLGDGGILQLGFGVEPQGGIIDSPAWPVLIAGFLEWASDDGLGSASGLELAPGECAREPWPVAPREGLRRLVLSGPWNWNGARTGESEKTAPRLGEWNLDLPPRAERLALPVLSLPGPYRVQLQGAAEPAPRRWVSCRIAPVESSTARLPAALLERIASVSAATGGAMLKGAAAGEAGEQVFAAALQRLRPGRPLAPWLWPLFGLAMVLELGVLVLRRRSG